VNTTFAQAVAALTDVLGAPTETSASKLDNYCLRETWDITRTRADGWSQYRVYVSVCDDDRGLVIEARRFLSNVNVAPPEMMVSAPYKGCAKPHTIKRIATAVEVLAVPTWEPAPVLTTLAVAVEVVAIVATPGEYL
jgi:hypothetical protein